MKRYIKIWLTSFFATATLLTLAAILFAIYLNNSLPQSVSPEPDTKPSQSEEPVTEDYINYSDNVGGVGFTEDQITELVRNIYFGDECICDLHVDFKKDGTVSVNVRLKDIDKLCETYPELDAYKTLLNSVENKQISITGTVIDSDGMADYFINSASVGKLSVDVNMLRPFMQDGAFSELFNVRYDSIEISDNSVIFKNGIPEVLQY